MQRIVCNGMAQLDFEDMWPMLQGIYPTGATLRSLHSPKLVELRVLLRHLVVEQRRKVVLFSQWRRMLRLAHWAVSDLLEEAGLCAVFFSGEEGQRRRTQNLVDFHDDPHVAMLLCTDAGGVGLNLQRAASCCVNVELPWNPAVLEQRVGRVYRLGQDNPVEVYNLVSEEGLEAHIAELVSTKQALFKGLFDGDSDEVQFEHSGSFLGRLAKMLPQVEIPELEADQEDSVAELAAVEAKRPADARAQVVSGPDTHDTAGRAVHLSAPVLASLFSQIELKPAPGGKVAIEAPREVVSALAEVLGGLAAQLRGSTRTTTQR